MNKSRLEEIRTIKLGKLIKLRELGIEAYPAKARKDYPNKEILENYAKYEGKEVCLAGRLMSLREHGNIAFGHLQDETGKIQVFVQKKTLHETSREKQILGFKDFVKLLDIGDFIEVKGVVGKTVRGEISIIPSEIKILTKSIRPLPEKWHGIKDEELRYRQRYVDLLVNEDLKDLFRKKALFWQGIRDFMIDKGFLEVETPVLENTAGGADANPFVTHHAAFDIDLYLRISMGELWQKRLMVAGFEKTFEIGRQFRNEGLSREHLQDYTQMEFYWAYADYEDSMNLVEEMYKYVAQKVFGKLEFKINGFSVNLDTKWERIDYVDTIKTKFGIDVSISSEDELRKKLDELKAKYDKKDTKGRLVDTLWKQVRKEIGGPVFLVGHPVLVSPLSKRLTDRPDFTQRYQIILAGSEMGNGYSELNDPVDQADRFKAQQKMRDEGDSEAQMHDYDFVRALEFGMPPVTGFGVSERLFSFLADLPVREAVLFPLLKPLEKKLVKTIPSSNEKTGSYAGSISNEIKEKFSGISFAYTIISGVSIEKKNKELEKFKKEVLATRKDLSLEEIKEIHPIKVYRKMLKDTGVDVNSRRPSPEALLRRIVQGKGIYTINTAVDAYNMAVVETGIGLGGFNVEKTVLPVTLRFSNKGEKMHLLGDDEPTETREGEIVYADTQKLLTLDLNYRDIDATKITLDTKDIILFADGGPGIDFDDVVKALKKGADYIHQFCGGKVGTINLVK